MISVCSDGGESSSVVDDSFLPDSVCSCGASSLFTFVAVIDGRAPDWKKYFRRLVCLDV